MPKPKWQSARPGQPKMEQHPIHHAEGAPREAQTILTTSETDPIELAEIVCRLLERRLETKEQVAQTLSIALGMYCGFEGISKAAFCDAMRTAILHFDTNLALAARRPV